MWVLTWLATSRLGQMVGALGVAIVTVLGAYGYGRMKERQAEKERAARQKAKQLETRGKVDEAINNLPGSAVRDRLRGDARE